MPSAPASCTKPERWYLCSIDAAKHAAAGCQPLRVLLALELNNMPVTPVLPFIHMGARCFLGYEKCVICGCKYDSWQLLCVAQNSTQQHRTTHNNITDTMYLETCFHPWRITDSTLSLYGRTTEPVCLVDRRLSFSDSLELLGSASYLRNVLTTPAVDKT